jgi:hypothetical protein
MRDTLATEGAELTAALAKLDALIGNRELVLERQSDLMVRLLKASAEAMRAREVVVRLESEVATLHGHAELIRAELLKRAARQAVHPWWRRLAG